MTPIKQMLSDMRGEPLKCDFCEEDKTLDDLEPEEAGMWVCHTCMERWDRDDKERRSQEAMR